MEWEDADALGVWKKDELGVALPGLCGTTLRESCHFDESCWDHLLENLRYSQSFLVASSLVSGKLKF